MSAECRFICLHITYAIALGRLVFPANMRKQQVDTIFVDNPIDFRKTGIWFCSSEHFHMFVNNPGLIIFYESKLIYNIRSLNIIKRARISLRLFKPSEINGLRGFLLKKFRKYLYTVKCNCRRIAER